MNIRTVTNPTEKARIIKEVLADLPKWFGLPESTQKYVQDGTKLPLWAAYEDHEAVALINLTNSSKDCGVIYCMGGKKSAPPQRNWKAIDRGTRRRSPTRLFLPTG